jgi:hypothetical protein
MSNQEARKAEEEKKLNVNRRIRIKVKLELRENRKNFGFKALRRCAKE